MGYRTVKQVPNLRTYDDAHRWWSMTKPIRGRNVDLRPLAERRYADCYSIRKNPSNEAIECVLYRTPVVTFMPDGEIHITNGGYITASTHMFIQEVLGYSVRNVRAVRGRTVGDVNGQAFTMRRDEVIKIKRDEQGLLRLVNPQTLYDYRMKRKAANNVRARYKEFRDYMSGFIKVRTQEKSTGYGPQMLVGVGFGEMLQVYETYEWHSGNTTYTNLSTDKYNLLHDSMYAAEGYTQKYTASMQTFLGWVTDQSEDKHNSFYKATLMLLGHQRRMTIARNDGEATLWTAPDAAFDLMDKVLLRWHADEVLEKYELPPGKKPTSKYLGWVKEENT